MLTKARTLLQTSSVDLDSHVTESELRTQTRPDDIGSHVTKSEQRMQSCQEVQDRTLVEVRTRLTENNQLISAGNTLADRMSERLDWIRKLGSDLRSFMVRIIAGNLAIYQEVIAIRKSIGALHRPLNEDPFILEDALGRIAPVHLRFITSWDAFDAVMELRLKGLKGSVHVRKKQYILQEHATRREIDRTANWDSVFFPGQKVDMSLIFRKDTRVGETLLSSCPNCHSASDKATGTEVQWF